MTYRDLKVKHAASIELLFELIQRNGLHTSAQKIEYTNNPHVSTIAIGNDNIASIYLSHDDVDVLNDIIAVADSISVYASSEEL